MLFENETGLEMRFKSFIPQLLQSVTLQPDGNVTQLHYQSGILAVIPSRNIDPDKDTGTIAPRHQVHA